jgi:Mrp family chromosome partitioning ATPase
MNTVETLSIHRAALALRESADAGAGGAVVLVTSARAGEGKSTIAALLARALASHQDGDVLLVEAGLTATAGGGKRSGAGLAGLLAGAPLDSVVQVGTVPGLWHLGRGDGYHASQLFRAARLREGLSPLRRRFALTVVDGPELAACGALLAQADSNLLVVDASRTPGPTVKAALDNALAIARIGSERLVGVVLNRQPAALPRWLGG